MWDAMRSLPPPLDNDTAGVLAYSKALDGSGNAPGVRRRAVLSLAGDDEQILDCEESV